MNNQNESPLSNPKFLVAIVVTFLCLWGWQYYMNKTYPPVIQTATQSKASAPTSSQPTTSPTAAAPEAQTKPATLNAAAAAEEKLFKYEDESVQWQLSSNGMGLENVVLKKYKGRDQKQIEFISNDNIFSLYANNQKLKFNVTKISEVEYRGEALVDGKKITRTILFNKDKAYFESAVEFDPGLQNITISLDEKKLVHKNTSFFMPSFERQDFLYREAAKVVTEHISALAETDTLDKRAGAVTLASISTQYFTTAIIDKSDMAPGLDMKVQGQQAKMLLSYNLANSQIKNLKQIFYVGAKNTDVLKQIDPLMPEVMDYGMFGFISKPLLKLMRFMHDLLGNWGLAIIGLTLIVRVFLLPFNIMSFRSARAMQKIQPLLKEIRDRYKSDPLKVNRETMALMKEHKANPLSGCLPMFIQIPIFFALWKTIGSSVEIYQQPFFGWIQDLSSHDTFFVIPVLMGITMYFQQKLTPTTMDPAQQKILNFMPIIFTVFMFSLPSGLTLYNFVSALFGVVQQYFLLQDKAAKAA